MMETQRQRSILIHRKPVEEVIEDLGMFVLRGSAVDLRQGWTRRDILRVGLGAALGSAMGVAVPLMHYPNTRHLIPEGITLIPVFDGHSASLVLGGGV